MLNSILIPPVSQRNQGTLNKNLNGFKSKDKPVYKQPNPVIGEHFRH
jgi:hypothetical protein